MNGRRSHTQQQRFGLRRPEPASAITAEGLVGGQAAGPEWRIAGPLRQCRVARIGVGTLLSLATGRACRHNHASATQAGAAATLYRLPAADVCAAADAGRMLALRGHTTEPPPIMLAVDDCPSSHRSPVLVMGWPTADQAGELSAMGACHEGVNHRVPGMAGPVARRQAAALREGGGRRAGHRELVRAPWRCASHTVWPLPDLAGWARPHGLGRTDHADHTTAWAGERHLHAASSGRSAAGIGPRRRAAPPSMPAACPWPSRCAGAEGVCDEQ